MARYSDKELRELYKELYRSRDKGVSGLINLLNSIWRIDDVNWKAVKKELMNLPSGRKVIKRMEQLPYFYEIASGKYQDVVNTLSKEGKDKLFDQWEHFGRAILNPIEDEWVGYHMMKYKMASELIKVAKDLVAVPIEYDSRTESKYVKHYQSMLGNLMRKPHIDYQIEAAKTVYDGVEFINEAGILYKLQVNKNAKNENEIIKVTASKDGQKQTKNISPSNIPFMLG